MKLTKRQREVLLEHAIRMPEDFTTRFLKANPQTRAQLAKLGILEQQSKAFLTKKGIKITLALVKEQRETISFEQALKKIPSNNKTATWEKINKKLLNCLGPRSKTYPADDLESLLSEEEWFLVEPQLLERLLASDS